MTELTDEDYMVSRARSAYTNDTEAKAWLITARCLYPNNFKIQFEAYLMTKTARKVSESASHLEYLLNEFRNEPSLLDEMKLMTEATRSDARTEPNTFYKDLFESLGAEIQYVILYRTAEQCEDTEEHCRLLFSLLQKFPGKISVHGLKLIDTLLTAEKHGHYVTACNSYRKLLVCDIMPLVLNSNALDIGSKQMCLLLFKAIEYYVVSCIQPGYSHDTDGDKVDGVDSNWHNLYELMHLCGVKQGWELKDMFRNFSKDAQWRTLHSCWSSCPGQPPQFFGNSSSADADSAAVNHDKYIKQVSHFGLVFFLNSLISFAARSDWKNFSNRSPNSQSDDLVLFLIEKFSDSHLSDTDIFPPKRPRLNSSIGKIDPPSLKISKYSQKLAPNCNGLITDFVCAVRGWELLTSDENLSRDFHKFLQQLKLNQYRWFTDFQIDYCIYQGMYQDAIDRLLSNSQLSLISMERHNIKLASCNFCLGNCTVAFDYIFRVLKSLSTHPVCIGTVAEEETQAGRQLCFMTASRQEIFSYCFVSIISYYKEVLFKTTSVDDDGLGHFIVLIQYDWPKYETAFEKCLERICKQGAFQYSNFFKYIINVDMIEEFAYLVSRKHDELYLDIMPTSVIDTKARAVTRGVNKVAKGDLKAAMFKQLSRCNESVEQLLLNFLIAEWEGITYWLEIDRIHRKIAC